MNIVIYFYANGRHRWLYVFNFYPTLIFNLKAKNIFTVANKYVRQDLPLSFFFEMLIKTAWFANATSSFMIIVVPNNGDYWIFFPFLQSAKPDSWKEKLSSNAFARKVISKYIVQGLKCTSREILTIVWRFMLTPFFFAFAVASIFTNCGRSSPLSVWWNGPKFSLQMVGEVDH